MIEIEDAQRLTQWVVWGGILIGIAVGALSQATRFCTLGAIADAHTMGNFLRLRMWMLAVAVAILLTQSLILAGLLNDQASFYTSSRLLLASHIVGGLLFGFGMTLASGCGSRMLIKMGEGSLKAVVVFLVMGLAALMSIRGATALLRANTVDLVTITLPSPQDLPHLLSPQDDPSSLFRIGLTALIAFVLLVFALWRGEIFQKAAHGLGGLGIGILVALGWALTGWFGYIPEHPETLQAAFVATNSKSPESLTFVGPLAFSLEYLLFTSDRSQAITFAIGTVIGLPIGAAASAVARGKFKWEGFQNTNDLSRHLIGASLMGIGGVTAMGCTFGHGLSGLSMLALGSLISILSIIAGAWMGLRWLSRKDQ
ncbi:Sulphur transport domain containing protein [Burkholderiales bacterium]